MIVLRLKAGREKVRRNDGQFQPEAAHIAGDWRVNRNLLEVRAAKRERAAGGGRFERGNPTPAAREQAAGRDAALFETGVKPKMLRVKKTEAFSFRGKRLNV